MRPGGGDPTGEEKGEEEVVRRDKPQTLGDSMVVRLGLNTMGGQFFTVAALLRQTLVMLLESGALTREQAAEVFNRTDAKIAEARDSLEVDSEGERQVWAQFFAEATQTAQTIRRRVLTARGDEVKPPAKKGAKKGKK